MIITFGKFTTDFSEFKNKKIPGTDLLSQGGNAPVPSALEGLTTVFGMGTGVSPPVWAPGKSNIFIQVNRVSFGALSWFCSQAARVISTGRLHPLLGFHLRPINRVFSPDPSGGGLPHPREA